MKTVNKCDYCKNRDGVKCSNCKNFKRIAGRQKIIDALDKNLGYKYHCKILNVVEASEKVLFKDLARFFSIPAAKANLVTTNEDLARLLEEHTPSAELMDAIEKYIPGTSEIFAPMEPYIESYVYDYAGMIYGQSIHASGTLLSKEPINMAISEDTACANGHYCEELGYIKYDLLSLSNLDSIEDIQGMAIDWNNVDEDVIKYIHDGNLEFTFQFGSPVVDNMIHGITLDQMEGIDGKTQEEKDAIPTEHKVIEAILNLSEVTSINRPGCLSINLNKTWVDMKNINEESEEYKVEQMVTDQINKLISDGKLKI